jgi:hypothetical protein
VWVVIFTFSPVPISQSERFKLLRIPLRVNARELPFKMMHKYISFATPAKKVRDGSGSSVGQQALGATPPESSSSSSGPISKVCDQLQQELRLCSSFAELLIDYACSLRI